ncbi:hypothetical protein HZS_1423, partial [Henneguya salminicola]
MACVNLLYFQILMASDEAKNQVKSMMEKYSAFKIENISNKDLCYIAKSDNIERPIPGKIVPVILNRNISNNYKSKINSLNEKEPKLNTSCVFVPTCCHSFNDKNHKKYEEIILKNNIDIKMLKKLAWNGVPDCCRLKTWQLLSGILPLSTNDHADLISQKRIEYKCFINSYYEYRKTEATRAVLRQIGVDIPRTYPLFPLFQNYIVQQIYERILYIWSVRHPASGYVQGINDLLSPFMFSALYPYFGDKVFNSDPSILTTEELHAVEADSYWLLTKLLDKII